MQIARSHSTFEQTTNQNNIANHYNNLSIQKINSLNKADYEMKYCQTTLVFTTIFAFLLLPQYVMSSYFQPCEYIECYLYPNASSTIKFKVSVYFNYIFVNQLLKIYLKHFLFPWGRIQQNSTVMDVMQRKGFNMMINILTKTGLANNLTAAGPFTIFALTDDGFKELKSKAPAWYNYFISNPIPVLLDFIVKGLVKPSNIRPGMTAMSQGGKVYFDSVDNGKVYFVAN